MGYYVRAFCKSPDVPPIERILTWLEANGVIASISEEYKDIDLKSSNWEAFSYLYKEGKLPILVDCNRDDGSSDCLFKEETGEFLELIGSPGISLSKRKVINHLNTSKYVVACQLPTSDIDDDGYDANGWFLQFFYENCDGMIQADGEGFYLGNKLVLKEDW